jgi:FlaA1/EpsC-like NDP-sugar epimerase
MDILKIIGRSKNLFEEDLLIYNEQLKEIIKNSSFLVIGGAGSIGQAVSIEIFKRNPKKLHIVDLSENNLAELVRQLRSTIGYIDGEFKTFALDSGSLEFEVFFSQSSNYDFILNLSALKHVRSEKDPYTLMRLIEVNIFNTLSLLELLKDKIPSKYFCVSTDKATNPVNMMGASKRIMEMFLMNEKKNIPISTARFANVAFSDGSLLHSFNQRILKQSPISGPKDILRYFITPEESGQLCLLSSLLAETGEIFFPRLSEEIKLTSFVKVAERYLAEIGYEPHFCDSEEEARNKTKELINLKKWPCFFSVSDTTGEKDFEEFFTTDDILDMERFRNIGIIKDSKEYNPEKLSFFISEIKKLRSIKNWKKEDLVNLFEKTLENFKHTENNKNLDQKM